MMIKENLKILVDKLGCKPIDTFNLIEIAGTIKIKFIDDFLMHNTIYTSTK